MISPKVTLREVSPFTGEVRRIWNGASHCAFTDLIRFQERWYCAFRESDTHAKGQDGVIRVLESHDGDEWMSVALIVEIGQDLRDPQFSITTEGRLMLLYAAPVFRDGKFGEYDTHAVFSPDGWDWTPPQLIGFPGEWLWRLTWYEGMAYGISREFYPEAEGRTLQRGHLIASPDGITFQRVASLTLSGATECALHFANDGRMTAVVRRCHGNHRSAIGYSDAPYTDWRWHDVSQFIGGQRLIGIGKHGLLCGARHYTENGPDLRVGGQPYTELAWVRDGEYQPFLRLPSGGDSSYPGFVWHGDELWMSYYSSHEETTAIYLARIPIDQLRT